MKKALIFGINGQVGSYLTEFLLEKKYEVHGVIRRSSTFNTERIDHLYQDPHVKDRKLFLHYGDLSDSSSISRIVEKVKPDETYNLGAMSHVRVSFDIPEYTGDVTGLGTLRILEAIRSSKIKAKFFQASSCYDSDTKVVTKNGIKTYKEIKEGDLVYTVNVLTNYLELKPIKKIIKNNFNGNLVHFNNRRINILVTPNHKMLFNKDNEGLLYYLAENVKNFLPYNGASNLSLPKPIWRGKNISKISFSDYISFNYHYNTYKNLITEMEAKDYLYLLGLYIGDGYTKPKDVSYRKCSAGEFIKNRNSLGQFISFPSKDKEKIIRDSNYIQFAIPKEDRARGKLISILNKYNLEYKTFKITVDFSSYTLARMFKQCGKNVYEKHIPDWVSKLSSNLLEYLFEGMIDSDGSRRKIKNERYSYVTVSKQLAEDFILLCYKIGKIPSLRICNPGIVYFKEKKSLRKVGFNSKTAYRINIAYKTTSKIYNKNIKSKFYNGITWCLEIENNHNFLTVRDGKFAFCGNSEMFGKVQEIPQKETTPFYPMSPYGVAKLYAYWITRNYRESYNMFACNGVMFNMESERRGETFVTRKITRGLARIALGEEDKLYLGNLDAKRDWGYCPNYVKGIWLTLQQNKPDDYVFATGETHSVREFVEETSRLLGLDLVWKGKGINEKGIDKLTGKVIIEIDPVYFRPAEVDLLVGDASKARKKLGWKPKTKFKELIRLMLESDLKKENNG